MNKKKLSPKIDLEYLINISVNEYNISQEDLDKPEFKSYIQNIFNYMHRLDKIRFKFDAEYDRIIKGNKKVDEPVYDELDIKNLLQQIKYIDSLPKQVQKSKEWYEFRAQNITASSIGSICKGNSSYYEEIRRKCDTGPMKQLSGQAILHGVKYEPVATALYERRNRVKVLEYGCLPHKYIDHLAASPDGICDYSPHNPSYTGRMLEIKCPYSRQITGIIPDGYYHQIQVQLEVCDLYYCDFMECKLVDFLSFQEMMQHSQTITNNTFRSDEYGVVFEYTMTGNNKLQYAYSDIGLSEDELDEWVNDKIAEINTQDPNFILQKISYWLMEFSSIVLVKRDRSFFQRILPTIQQFWKDVEYFRAHPGELSNYIANAKPKNDYYAIDLLVNKGSDSESDKDDNKTKIDMMSQCMISDSDSEGDIVIKADIEKKPKKKKSPKKVTMQEHFKSNKKEKSKYKNISSFSACMID